MKGPEDKKWWTPKEAAAFLQIHVQTLYAFISPRKYKTNGKLLGPPPPYRRISAKVIRIPRVKFIEWAERLDTPTQGKR